MTFSQGRDDSGDDKSARGFTFLWFGLHCVLRMKKRVLHGVARGGEGGLAGTVL